MSQTGTSAGEVRVSCPADGVNQYFRSRTEGLHEKYAGRAPAGCRHRADHIHGRPFEIFEPGRFDEFCRVFTEEMNRLRREHRTKLAATPREIAAIDHRPKQILDYINTGFGGVEAWKQQVRQNEARRAELQAIVAAVEAEPPPLALHPRMADVFRKKTMQLAAALEHTDEEQRESARQAIRNLIDRIVIPPGDGLLQVAGNLGEMLTAAGGRAALAAVGYVGRGGPQPAVLAAVAKRRLTITLSLSITFDAVQ